MRLAATLALLAFPVAARAAAPPAPDVASLVGPAVDAGALDDVVVGTVDASGRTRVLGFGHARAGGPAPDGKTLFEIGSATKLFTALVLASLVVDKKVALDDPVQKYLPPDVKMPTVDGKPVTLAHLATHTSGLPRMPSNFAPRDPSQPYADYDARALYAYLATASLRWAPGLRYDYSNLGAALLGHALSLEEKQGYEALVRARITGPLGMADTHVAPLAGDGARLAEGHDGDGNPAAPWRFDVMAPAGAIRSTVDDMLVFLRAQLGDVPPAARALAPAIALTHEPRHDLAGLDPGKVALGWHLRDGGRTVWHNGQTGGYHSYVAFDPQRRVAVVVLAGNASMLVDDLGYAVLRGLAGEAAPPVHVPPRAVALAPAKLDPLVGVYQLAPGFDLAVRRDGDHLVVQASGQPSFRIFPTSDTHFFLRAVAAEIDFRPGELVLHQNGHDVVGKRVAPR